MPYIGGVGAYRRICDDVAAKGYEGVCDERVAVEQPQKMAASS
jgi:cyclohexanone monooxygenase